MKENRNGPFFVILLLAVVVSGGCFVSAPKLQPKVELTQTINPTETQRPTIALAPTITPTQEIKNTSEPTGTMVPKSVVESTPEFEPFEFSGIGKQVIDLDLPFNIGFIHAVHSGEGNFAISTWDDTGIMVDLPVNTIGNYDGYVPFDLYDYQNATRIDVMASGTWKITIYPMDLAYIRSCQIPGECKGNGDDLFFLFGKTADTAKIIYKGEGNFIVTEVGEETRNTLVNEIGNYEGVVMFDSPMFLIVKASGPWTINITTK